MTYYHTPDGRIWRTTQKNTVLNEATIAEVLDDQAGKEATFKAPPVVNRLCLDLRKNRWRHQALFGDQPSTWRTLGYYPIDDVKPCKVAKKHIDLSAYSIPSEEELKTITKQLINHFSTESKTPGTDAGC